MKKKMLTFVCTLLACITYAQNLKFGKVSKEELAEKYYPLDSSANAAFLYKNRKTYYDYNPGEGFLLKTKIHERIKFYNKEGFDWATKQIQLYNQGSDEKVSLKAYTFNLNGNKIEKVKLKNSEIFKEQINKYWYRKKFTMPDLKAGSVVEWEYTITSPYVGKIDDVVFQYSIPVKYVESKIEIPEYFIFKNVSQGFYPVNFTKTEESGRISFVSKERTGGDGLRATRTDFQTNQVDYKTSVTRGVASNVPAIREEPFVNNINNYRTILKYEHTSTKFPDSPIKYYNTTWEDVAKTIYRNPNFGGQLNNTSFFKEDLNASIEEAQSNEEKIIKIFQLVKSKIKWDGYYGKYVDKGIKKALKDGTGNAAEVNLALIAMMQEAGLKAYPILVSTRKHGIPLFPTTDGFNYVIAGVEVQNSFILLDATEQYSTPNILPLRALNWQGRLVKKDGTSVAINLFSKNTSKRNSFINAEINDEGIISGMKRTSVTNHLAQNFRNKHGNTSDNDVKNTIEQDFNIEISEIKISNKKDPYKPLVELFKFESEDLVETVGDKMYINPLLFLTKNQNPFKAEQRKFPIDFGITTEELSRVTLKIPDGYTIESLPEKTGIGLPENIGMFKFLASEKNNEIHVSCSIKINTPIIPSNYYIHLKEFYNTMIKKQSEKIVLTKI